MGLAFSGLVVVGAMAMLLYELCSTPSKNTQQRGRIAGRGIDDVLNALQKSGGRNLPWKIALAPALPVQPAPVLVAPSPCSPGIESMIARPYPGFPVVLRLHKDEPYTHKIINVGIRNALFTATRRVLLFR